MEIDDSILGELEDQVTCWVCFEVFDEPVTLHCGHSFCKECCIKMYKKNPLCAFCRREFGLPLPGVNERLVALAAQYKRQGELMDTIQGLDIEQDSIWLSLPDEVLLDVLGYLPPPDLSRTGLVCHQLKQLADDSWLWREHCKQRFPFVQVSRYSNNWKRAFVLRHRMQKGWESGRPGDFKMQALRGHRNYISCFDYYRNNVVSGSADNTIKVWSVNQAKPLHSLDGHTSVVNSVQFNEIRIVSGADDSTVRVWDSSTGAATNTMAHNGAVNCLQFNEANILSGGNDSTVRVWDVRTGGGVRTLQGHTQAITQLDYSGDRVVSLAGDGIRVWDLKTGACVHNLVGISLHASSSLVQMNCYRPMLKVCALGMLQQEPAHIRSLMITGRAKLLPYNPYVHLLQAEQDPLKCTLVDHTTFFPPFPLLSSLQDGNYIVASHAGNNLTVYDFKSKRHLRTLADHTGRVHMCQFDGHKIVSGSADNTLKVWDVKTGKRLYSLLGGSLQERSNNPPHPHRPGCSGLKFDDGRIVASFNSLLRVYNFTGEE